MTVKELIEELRKFPPDAPVALSAMGHDYDSVRHAMSHGPLYVLPFVHGRVMICNDTGAHYRKVAAEIAPCPAAK